MSGNQTQPQPQAPWEAAWTQLAAVKEQKWVQKEDIAAAIALPIMHMLVNAKLNKKQDVSKQEFPLQDVGLGFANQVVARNLVERLFPDCPPKAIHAATSLVAGGLLSMEAAFGLHNGKQYCNFAEGAVASSLASLLAALTCQAEQQKKQKEQLGTSQQSRER